MIKSTELSQGSIEVSGFTITGHVYLRDIMRRSIMRPDIPVINGISCIADPRTLMYYAFKLTDIENYRRKTKKAGFETILNAVLHNVNDFDIQNIFSRIHWELGRILASLQSVPHL